MIGTNATAASLAAADDRRIGARQNEYLARYGAEDAAAAMLQAFAHLDRDAMTERGYVRELARL